MKLCTAKTISATCPHTVAFANVEINCVQTCHTEPRNFLADVLFAVVAFVKAVR